MVTDAWHSGGLITAAGSRGYQQASFPTCSCLLRSVVKTVLRETFLRIFVRRMAKRCLSSGRTWPRRSDVCTGLPLLFLFKLKKAPCSKRPRVSDDAVNCGTSGETPTRSVARRGQRTHFPGESNPEECRSTHRLCS